MVKVPRSLHHKLAQPNFFRHLRSTFGVSVDAPRVSGGASSSSSSGKPANGRVIQSSAAEARIDADDAENSDEEPMLNSFSGGRGRKRSKVLPSAQSPSLRATAGLPTREMLSDEEADEVAALLVAEDENIDNGKRYIVVDLTDSI